MPLMLLEDSVLRQCSGYMSEIIWGAEVEDMSVVCYPPQEEVQKS